LSAVVELADRVAEYDRAIAGHGQSQWSPRKPTLTPAAARIPSGNMDALALFGLFAVTAMLVFYALAHGSLSHLQRRALWDRRMASCKALGRSA